MNPENLAARTTNSQLEAIARAIDSAVPTTRSGFLPDAELSNRTPKTGKDRVRGGPDRAKKLHSIFLLDAAVFHEGVQQKFKLLWGITFTGCGQRMPHRKWKETKQQPSMLPGPAVPGCCLVSFYFLCPHMVDTVQDLQEIPTENLNFCGTTSSKIAASKRWKAPGRCPTYQCGIKYLGDKIVPNCQVKNWQGLFAQLCTR